MIKALTTESSIVRSYLEEGDNHCTLGVSYVLHVGQIKVKTNKQNPAVPSSSLVGKKKKKKKSLT